MTGEAPAPSLPVLRRGDRVAVLALSSAVEAHRLEPGLGVLRGWGLEVVEGESLRSPPLTATGSAAADARRAAEFAAAWLDPSISAIWCARGGYGMQRLLAGLDWQRLRPAPAKLVVGFSDVTPLLHRVVIETGSAAVHGPMITGLAPEVDPAGVEAVRRLVFGEFGPGHTLLAGLRPWTAHSRAAGPLTGGNVALLANSIGCGDLTGADGAVVILEDVGQPSWVIDRNLTQLRRSGWLVRPAAVVLGDFDLPGGDAETAAVLADHFADAPFPVYSHGRFGHREPNLALPVGTPVALDGDRLLVAS